MDEIEAAKRVMREWGKKGGRPRTVGHRGDGKFCRCAECRKAREERKGGVKVKVETAKGAGVEAAAVRVIEKVGKKKGKTDEELAAMTTSDRLKWLRGQE